MGAQEDFHKVGDLAQMSLAQCDDMVDALATATVD
jgi:hypothetical protein